jgi:hypothetical protein
MILIGLIRIRIQKGQKIHTKKGEKENEFHVSWRPKDKCIAISDIKKLFFSTINILNFLVSNP